MTAQEIKKSYEAREAEQVNRLLSEAGIPLRVL